MDFKGKSIVSIRDISKKEILHILEVANGMEENPKHELFKGKVMASLFFEPSTRTRLSFESAMKKLGGEVVGFAEAGVSSAKKGESLSDTVKTVEHYSDVIVMRHPLEGTARLASEVVSIPVLNGGDGANQHPTQTLLDLYTMLKTQKKLEGLKVAMVGDLKYGRTVHSLAIALAQFKCRMYFVSPDSLKMPDYIIEELKEKDIEYSEHKEIKEIMDKVDILYMTRIQRERFSDPSEYEKVKNVYVLTKDMLADVRPNLKIMHPLPRVNEIAAEIDATPHAVYFQQAANGIFVRQALIALVLGAVK